MSDKPPQDGASCSTAPSATPSQYDLLYLAIGAYFEQFGSPVKELTIAFLGPTKGGKSTTINSFMTVLNPAAIKVEEHAHHGGATASMATAKYSRVVPGQNRDKVLHFIDGRGLGLSQTPEDWTDQVVAFLDEGSTGVTRRPGDAAQLPIRTKIASEKYNRPNLIVIVLPLDRPAEAPEYAQAKALWERIHLTTLAPIVMFLFTGADRVKDLQKGVPAHSKLSEKLGLETSRCLSISNYAPGPDGHIEWKKLIPEKSCAILEVLNDLLVQAKITQPVGIIEGAADRILEKKPWEVFLKINASHLIILLIGVMVTWLLLKNGH